MLKSSLKEQSAGWRTLFALGLFCLHELRILSQYPMLHFSALLSLRLKLSTLHPVKEIQDQINTVEGEWVSKKYLSFGI